MFLIGIFMGVRKYVRGYGVGNFKERFIEYGCCKGRKGNDRIGRIE